MIPLMCLAVLFRKTRIEKKTDFLYEVWLEVALCGGECVCLVFARNSALPFVGVAVQVGRGILHPLTRCC